MDYRLEVESALHDYCVTKGEAAAKIDKRYAHLWQEIGTYLLNGGKRVRPQLVLWAYEAYGGKNREELIRVGAAWELLHACLLIHDDIIDRDFIRHGKPNIAGTYQSIYGELTQSDISHYALSAALISGDLLLMGAYELVAQASINGKDTLIAQEYLNKALFTVAGGELIDTDAVLYPVLESQPLSVATHKTASYSLQLPLQCGAALAGAPETELEKLSEIGLHAGIAYQLQDDLLGTFGNSESTGKPNRSDIKEKKRTFMIIEALRSLEGSERSTLENLLSPDHVVSDEEAEKIVELILRTDARAKTEEIIEKESSAAIAIIEQLAVNEEHRQSFITLLTGLTRRTS